MDKHRDSIAVRRSLRGDGDAFAELARRYTGVLFSIAVGCGLRAEDAEDVTQDVLITAYRRLGRLRQPDSFRAWISRIAVRQARDARARHSRETPTDVAALLADVADPTPGHARFEREADSRRIVGDAVNRLPETLRLPFVMHEVGGATPIEIAEALATTRNNVDQRLRRAREQLRTHLRRRGLEAEALALLRSHALTLAASGEFASRVLEGIRGVSPEGATATTGIAYGRLAGSAAAVVALIGVLGGMSSVLSTPWGALKTEAATGADRAGSMSVAITPGFRPRVRLLMRPGEELQGWQALEPLRDAAAPVSGVGLGSRRAPVAVTANPYGIQKPMAAAFGEVTLSLRARVDRAPSNAIVGLMLGDSGSGNALLWKDETDTWRYSDYIDGINTARDIGPVRGEWRDVIAVYRTWSGRFDLYVDGEPVARNAVLSHTAPGKPVTGVYLSSGRGDRGSPLYFQDVRVTARDSAALRAAKPGGALPPPRPLPQDHMTLHGGFLAGQMVEAEAPVVTVRPGAPLSGWVDIEVENTHGSSGDFHVVETPTWGSHADSFRALRGRFPPGPSRHTAHIDRTAPAEPGVYHLIVAGATESSPELVASGTNWPIGAAVWEDGTDIAAWSVDVIDEAVRTGGVDAPWLLETDANTVHYVSPMRVAAVAVRVIVGP